MKNNKNRLIPFLIGAMALFGVGCEDRRMNNMIEDKVYLTKFGENVQNVFKWDNYTYELQVTKSGVGQQGGEVSLNVDESALTPYAAKYKLLPADLYKIKSTTLKLHKGDYSVPFEIELNTAGIEALKAATKLNYAVPFKLTTSTLTPAAESQLISVFVPNVLSPYIEFKTPGLSPATSSISTAIAPDETKFYVFLRTNYDNKTDLEYKVEMDEAVLTAYNLEKKTSHKLLPAEAYRIDASTFKIAKLNNEQALSYYLLKGKVPNGDYMLPLKIKTVAKHEINPEKSTILIPVKIQN
jgi:hypothetical protein